MILQFHATGKHLYKKELYKEFQQKREGKKHIKTLFKKLEHSDFLNF